MGVCKTFYRIPKLGNVGRSMLKQEFPCDLRDLNGNSDCDGKLSLVDTEYMFVVFVKSFSDPDVFHQCCLYKKLEVFHRSSSLARKVKHRLYDLLSALIFLGCIVK